MLNWSKRIFSCAEFPGLGSAGRSFKSGRTFCRRQAGNRCPSFELPFPPAIFCRSNVRSGAFCRQRFRAFESHLRFSSRNRRTGRNWRDVSFRTLCRRAATCVRNSVRSGTKLSTSGSQLYNSDQMVTNATSVSGPGNNESAVHGKPSGQQCHSLIASGSWGHAWRPVVPCHLSSQCHRQPAQIWRKPPGSPSVSGIGGGERTPYRFLPKTNRAPRRLTHRPRR